MPEMDEDGRNGQEIIAFFGFGQEHRQGNELDKKPIRDRID